jgi:hypothetical protein
MKPGVEVHVCNASIWESEAGGYQLGVQSGLPSEILSQKTQL